MLFLSLQKLKTLPDETRIYCGHEYTFTNAKFCSGIAPNNTAITQRFRDIEVLHEANTPTIPATLGLEKETNLFLQAESAEDFADLRKKRDNF